MLRLPRTAFLRLGDLYRGDLETVESDIYRYMGLSRWGEDRSEAAAGPRHTLLEEEYEATRARLQVRSSCAPVRFTGGCEYNRPFEIMHD